MDAAFAGGVAQHDMKRQEQVDRLGEAYDVLVVGGGATGLGVAVDSASRGYRTLLVDARDFAQGTSSRSTKLIHGGVRYLQQGNVSLVREALRERELLLTNAPLLAEERRFLLPAYAVWEKPFYGAGLSIYDRLAGSTRMDRTRVISRREALEMAPTLNAAGLRGGVLYSDGQFDDARLAMALARTAVGLGAVLVNGARVTALTREAGRLTGAIAIDSESGREYTLRARCVVNATGVFSDAVRRMDEPGAAPLLAASQGIHLVLDRSFLPGDTAILVPRTSDGRVIFIIPWLGRTLIGTTDTLVERPIEEPVPLADEVGFVLEHAGRYLSKQPERTDVLSAFAGLRPLVKASGRVTAALSRDHVLQVSASGLVTITGGKWTTYRRMAEVTVDRAARVAGLPDRPCVTAWLRLHGATPTNPAWWAFGAADDEIAVYESRYPGGLHPAMPYTIAMAAFAIDNEMPLHLEDVLSRRLRALLLDARAAMEAAPAVAHLMAALQGRDEAWEHGEVAAFRRLAADYLPAGGLTDG